MASASCAAAPARGCPSPEITRDTYSSSGNVSMRTVPLASATPTRTTCAPLAARSTASVTGRPSTGSDADAAAAEPAAVATGDGAVAVAGTVAGGRVSGVNSCAAISAASKPSPLGAATSTARVGASAGAKATTSPNARPPGKGEVPAFTSAGRPRRVIVAAGPYAGTPRSPARTTARVAAFMGTAASGPTPATRATALNRLRGEVAGPARPSTLDVQGAFPAIGSRPAPRRTSFNDGRGNRAARCTKKSVQE